MLASSLRQVGLVDHAVTTRPLTCALQASESVFVDLLTYSDLEMLRSRQSRKPATAGASKPNNKRCSQEDGVATGSKPYARLSCSSRSLSCRMARETVPPPKPMPSAPHLTATGNRRHPLRTSAPTETARRARRAGPGATPLPLAPARSQAATRPGRPTARSLLPPSAREPRRRPKSPREEDEFRAGSRRAVSGWSQPPADSVRRAGLAEKAARGRVTVTTVSARTLTIMTIIAL